MTFRASLEKWKTYKLRQLKSIWRKQYDQNWSEILQQNIFTPGNIVSQKSKCSVEAFQYIMEPRFPQEPACQVASGHLTYSLSNAHEGLVGKWDSGNPGFHLLRSQVLHSLSFGQFCRLLQLPGSKLTRGQESGFQIHCSSAVWAPRLPVFMAPAHCSKKPPAPWLVTLGQPIRKITLIKPRFTLVGNIIIPVINSFTKQNCFFSHNSNRACHCASGFYEQWIVTFVFSFCARSLSHIPIHSLDSSEVFHILCECIVQVTVYPQGSSDYGDALFRA